MISPYLNEDGFTVNVANVKRHQYLKIARTAMRIYEITKDPTYAFYAKEFHDEALKEILKLK